MDASLRLVMRDLRQEAEWHCERTADPAPDCSPPSARIESLGEGEEFSGFVEVDDERNLPSVSVRPFRGRLRVGAGIEAGLALCGVALCGERKQAFENHGIQTLPASTIV